MSAWRNVKTQGRTHKAEMPELSPDEKEIMQVQILPRSFFNPKQFL
jgi:hypothetical protein